MIEAQGLTRRYGPFTAVQNVSFKVDEGEIVGILGPNGAGKTTTIRMITGFLPPSSGRVTVGGRDLFSEPRKARREIGYMPENVALYTVMRVREYLKYRAQLEGMKRVAASEAIDNTIRRCLLEEVEWQIIGTLSKGYRQRVGLAAAILHGPSVLVLDEPTVGLDPKQIIAIRELIRELGQKRTLLLSTHILPEVEQLCDRVFIIDQGRLVAEGTPQELRDQLEGNAVLNLTLKNATDDVAEMLQRVDGILGVDAEAANGEARFSVECDKGLDLREAVFRTAVEKGWTLLELTEKRVSLEDIFVKLTRQDGAPAEPPPDALAAQQDAGEESSGEETSGEGTGADDSEEVAS